MNENKEMRFTEGELELMRKTYGGNDALIKLLRKIFLPEYDPKAPLGQIVDLWMHLSDLEKMHPQDREIAILSHIKLIKHIEAQLMQIYVLANIKTETDEERTKRYKKDSLK